MLTHILWLLLYSPATLLSQRELTIAPPAGPVEYLVIGPSMTCRDVNGNVLPGPVYVNAICELGLVRK